MYTIVVPRRGVWRRSPPGITCCVLCCAAARCGSAVHINGDSAAPHPGARAAARAAGGSLPLRRRPGRRHVCDRLHPRLPRQPVRCVPGRKRVSKRPWRGRGPRERACIVADSAPWELVTASDRRNCQPRAREALRRPQRASGRRHYDLLERTACTTCARSGRRRAGPS